MKKIVLVTTCLLCLVPSLGSAKLSQTSLFCHLNQVYVKHSAVYFNKVRPSITPQVYLIKNTSSSTLFMNHIKANPGAGAGWASSIAPGHWSAIAVSETNFSLVCSKAFQGKTQQVNCRALQVCQPSRNGLTIQSEGNYWVAEDKSWPQLIEVLKEKNVLLNH
jgi:hypothetical protein